MESATPRNLSQTAPRRSQAGVLWLTQGLTGILLIVVLGLHMVAHHFVVEGGLRNFEQVVAYVSNPLIFATEVTFLVVVTIHALLGMRAMILDLGPPPSAVATINLGLTILGIVTIGYGIWLALTIQAFAR